MRFFADGFDGVEAVAGGAFEPGVGGDGGVVCGEAQGGAGGERGALQGGGLRVGLCPERCAAGGVGDGEREREASVGEGGLQQPVAEACCVRGGGGGGVDECFEGVQCAAGLALRCAQVGFQAPAVAAVGVAVAVDGGEYGGGVGLAEEERSGGGRGAGRGWP
ncbi:hypothetical protein GCM10010400_41460 [Streptomyces aculeolatus]|uniref:hypothetical protein n=1 Tax=Streptomyces aculeolatus TaxID=270689 RepID=UPI001CEDAB31|nr:hypothetical protein [Streptomyces aculeolatus]